jgi:hypothetical protein
MCGGRLYLAMLARAKARLCPPAYHGHFFSKFRERLIADSINNVWGARFPECSMIGYVNEGSSPPSA